MPSPLFTDISISGTFSGDTRIFSFYAHGYMKPSTVLSIFILGIAMMLWGGFFRAAGAQEQQGRLVLAGMVAEGEEPLADAVIKLYQGGRPVKTVRTGEGGDFTLEMELDGQYRIEFSKKGYVAKRIAVNSAVPEGMGGTWEADFSIGLFQMYPDLDVSALDDPVTRILYKEGERGFGYDEPYTRKMMALIDKILRQLERLKEEAYRRIIQKGNRHFERKEYEVSIEYYQKALDQRPDDRYPRKQIEKARELMQEREKRRSLYEDAIARADKLMNRQAFKKAREVYYEALDYDPAKTYPDRQISRIERLLKEKKEKERRRKERYRQLVEKADALFDAQQLAQARDKYKQALTVMEGQKHPRERIGEIDERIRKREARKARYKDIIYQADRAMTAGALQDATERYEQALDLQDEPYPREQLAKIDSLQEARKARQREYEDKVASADKAFKDEAYEKARRAYSAALQLIPDAGYPGSQMEKIDRILARREMQAQQYQEALRKGDQYFREAKYRRAQQSYHKGLEVRPQSVYIREQIRKIEEALEEREALNERYQGLIGDADHSFEKGSYDRSRDIYLQALEMKPGRDYPREQIDRIARILAKQEKADRAWEKYRDKLDEADAAYSEKKLHQAQDLYEEASAMRPNEDYPKTRIAAIKKILMEKRHAAARQQALEKSYRQAIDNGDEAFEKQAYREAREYYERAMSLMPEEKYPKDQIGRIDRILEKRRLTLQNYRQTIQRADHLFEREEYRKALSGYQKAQTLQPGEPYPGVQIKKINKLLSNLREKKKRMKQQEWRADSLYDQAVAQADELYGQYAYYDAKAFYEKALQHKPHEAYPKQRIRLCERKIRRFEQAEAIDQSGRRKHQSGQQSDPSGTPGLSPKGFENQKQKEAYLSNLAKEYPEGITVEQYEKGKRTITRVIVNYDGVATDYRKVKHSWGGTFYFRNGQSISGTVFRIETKER